MLLIRSRDSASISMFRRWRPAPIGPTSAHHSGNDPEKLRIDCGASLAGGIALATLLENLVIVLFGEVSQRRVESCSFSSNFFIKGRFRSRAQPVAVTSISERVYYRPRTYKLIKSRVWLGIDKAGKQTAVEQFLLLNVNEQHS